MKIQAFYVFAKAKLRKGSLEREGGRNYKGGVKTKG